MRIFISKETKLPNEGEKLFKHSPLKNATWKKLLIKLVKYKDYKKGLKLKLFKTKWKKMLMPISHFITCEGRNNTVLRYHISGNVRFSVEFDIFYVLEPKSYVSLVSQNL